MGDIDRNLKWSFPRQHTDTQTFKLHLKVGLFLVFTAFLTDQVCRIFRKRDVVLQAVKAINWGGGADLEEGD